MKLEFYKYQGTGNDFIIFDCRYNKLKLSSAEISQLCDRRFGIGADGVILLQLKEGYDFEMLYYNADGNLSSMCGNGGRCIVSFARRSGLIEKTAKFLAADGDHLAEIISTDPDRVKLKMSDVKSIHETCGGWFLDTGSPHLVISVDKLASLDVRSQGRLIRNSDEFKKEGVNVNFVENSGKGILVRTYERGVEDETLSCGTGVTAIALVAIEKNWVRKNDHTVEVLTKGGKLLVHAKKTSNGYSDIWLEGPAVHVFTGEWNFVKE
jgi:diaminopimelate epimerase